MSKNTTDTLGDRCKQFEQAEAGRKADAALPLVARLDGHGFSKFTKDLQRPFDPRFAQLMAATTCRLVEKTNAVVGYTQSDEITLIWAPCVAPHVRMFDGKFQKLTSLFAATATSVFTRRLPQYLPEKAEAEPELDCRVWNVPSLQDAVDALVWRELDAMKNSVSMLANTHFPEKDVRGKSSHERRAMLLEKGIDWTQQPRWAQRGRLFHRTEVIRTLTAAELAAIPAHCRPTGPVTRHAITEWGLPRLSTIDNLVGVIFGGEEPVLRTTQTTSALTL